MVNVARPVETLAGRFTSGPPAFLVITFPYPTARLPLRSPGAMNHCLDTSDLFELSKATLDESDRRLQAIPAELCAPFFQEARSLEEQLLGVYRTVALCVRKEDDLDLVAKWWEAMTKVCDQFAVKLGTLHEQHPWCGAGVFYDRVLDLRNRCKRLMNLHA